MSLIHVYVCFNHSSKCQTFQINLHPQMTFRELKQLILHMHFIHERILAQQYYKTLQVQILPSHCHLLMDYLFQKDTETLKNLVQLQRKIANKLYYPSRCGESSQNNSFFKSKITQKKEMLSNERLDVLNLKVIYRIKPTINSIQCLYQKAYQQIQFLRKPSSIDTILNFRQILSLIVPTIVKDKSSLVFLECYEIPKFSIKCYNDYESILQLKNILIEVPDQSIEKFHSCFEDQFGFKFLFSYQPSINFSQISSLKFNQKRASHINLKIFQFFQNLIQNGYYTYLNELLQISEKHKNGTYLFQNFKVDIKGDIKLANLEFLLHKKRKEKSIHLDLEEIQLKLLRITQQQLFHHLNSEDFIKNSIEQTELENYINILQEKQFHQLFFQREFIKMIQYQNDVTYKPIDSHFQWTNKCDHHKTLEENQKSTTKKVKKNVNFDDGYVYALTDKKKKERYSSVVVKKDGKSKQKMKSKDISVSLIQRQKKKAINISQFML